MRSKRVARWVAAVVLSSLLAATASAGPHTTWIGQNRWLTLWANFWNWLASVQHPPEAVQPPPEHTDSGPGWDPSG